MTDYTVGDTVYFLFTTRSFSTGAPTQLAGTPVISAYEDNSLTQITAGVSLGVDHDSVTGLNLVTVVATGANGFESGKDYHLVITTGTVGGVSVVGEVVGRFTLGRSAAAVDLANGTDGLGAIKTDTAAIKTKTDFLPSATAGSSGGLLISGANSGTTIFGAFTITGSFTVSDGLIISRSTVNSSAINLTGNGTGRGLNITGGILGDGARFTGGATSGNGITVIAAGQGHGLNATGSQTGHGIVANGGATSGDGIRAVLGGSGVDIRGNITGNLSGSIGSLGATAKTDVNNEVVNGLNVDTYSEPGQGSPPAAPTIRQMLHYLYKWTRNKKDNDGATTQFYNDAGTVVDHKQTTSEAAGTVTKGEIVTGP